MTFEKDDTVIFSVGNNLYTGKISVIAAHGHCVVMCEHRELMSNLEFSQNISVQVATNVDKLHLIKKGRKPV